MDRNAMQRYVTAGRSRAANHLPTPGSVFENDLVTDEENRWQGYLYRNPYHLRLSCAFLIRAALIRAALIRAALIRAALIRAAMALSQERRTATS